ncbi:MAG: diguanylate cyclase [Deltaproteobacteria bacterium]|nr:diguanylate cyclase [Deltaproteobacteria bacterium]
MQAPPSPPDETSRLAALRALGLLDTQAEERFDRLTRLAQRLLGVPIALISLVDERRQWFKSRQGLDVSETDRALSFCGHAILSDDIFLVPDATADERFSDNPMVVGAPNIRFYAGRPLHDANSHRVGTLCLIDSRPRQLSQEHRQLLEDLAALVEEQIQDVRTRRLLAQVQEQEARFRMLASLSPVGIFETDAEGRCVYTNKRWQDMTGLRAEAALGEGWATAIFSDDREAAFAEWKAAAQTGCYQSVFRFQRPDGSLCWVSARAAAIRNEDGAIIGWVGTDEDITTHRLAEEQLRASEAMFRDQATTDTLTGLANGRKLRDQLEHELARSRRHHNPVSFALLDIDRFKSVNDGYGHDAGDAALIHVAKLMKARLRATDLPARIGGDELCVLLPDTTKDQAVLVVEQLRVLIEASTVALPTGGTFRITVSAGVAQFDYVSNDDATRLMKRADEALYRAKAAGRNGVSL